MQLILRWFGSKWTKKYLWNANWCSYFGKQFGNFSKKFNKTLLYELIIPHLGTFLREVKAHGPRVALNVHRNYIHKSSKLETIECS